MSKDMCQSAEVSFGTWIFGMVSAQILWTRGKFAWFPFTVTQMQLIEGLRWIETVDERILAVLGKLALGLQPVAGLWDAGTPHYIVPQGVATLLTELVYGSRDLRFVVAGDGHFRWRWLEPSSWVASIPQWVALIYAAQKILPWEMNLLMLVLQEYQTIHHRAYKTEGSLWCVSVNLLWLYQLFR